MLPDFTDKRALDLGCGFGWHCKYAIENGAKSAIGIDLSENMLKEAKRINHSEAIEYIKIPIENIDYPKDSFDVVISSLAFHYIKSFEDIRKSVFLGEEVMKYHKTMTTYLNTLIKTGFEITGIVEPMPQESMLKESLEMQDELRRPMMLLISAIKK